MFYRLIENLKNRSKANEYQDEDDNVAVSAKPNKRYKDGISHLNKRFPNKKISKK